MTTPTNSGQPRPSQGSVSNAWKVLHGFFESPQKVKLDLDKAKAALEVVEADLRARKKEFAAQRRKLRKRWPYLADQTKP